ncbi:MAG: efflux RND transporter periplasmic adaptor subunit [Bacteroidales bacterium]
MITTQKLLTEVPFRNNKNLHRNMFSIPGMLLIALIATAMMGLSSCGQGQGSAANSDAEQIRSQISQYNEQILELTQKVSDLERELEALGERPRNRARIPVSLTTLDLEPFDHFFKVNASVEAVQTAMISPEASGQIRQIAVTKGQKVNRGQVLARLNTSVIENNLSELKTSLQLAQTVFERQKSLWEQEIGSEIQFLEARNNYESLQARVRTLESQLEMSVMRAPFDGIVDEIFAKEGELAMPGSRIMQLVNLSQIFINADVSETFLPMINPRDQAILRFPAFPEFEQRVPIHRLGNVINPENRTFRLQLLINNPGERFKPNMIASISVRSFSAPEAISIPSILIKQDLQGHYVYVARQSEQDDLVARKVYIERGLAGEGTTMVLDGLQPGDNIIRDGHNRVSDGSLIEVR